MSEVFGDYILEEELGSGGMAVTWRARERMEGFGERIVAVKQILPEHASNQQFREMFYDEVRITSLINHPNVCKIYRAGTVNDSLFMAMEYVDGASVAQLVKRLDQRGEWLPLEHALYVASRVLAGLSATHTQTDVDGRALSIVHRDVSPQNVLISRKAEVKLIDFGVAKAVSNTSQTRSGAIKGKVLYLSPEQLEGQKLDGRSDLFSAGLMLYELVTRHHPLRGTDEYATIFNYCTREIEPPSQHRQDIPPALDDLILKSLSRDRDARFPSARAMADAVNDLLFSLHPGYREAHFETFVHWLFDPESGPMPQLGDRSHMAFAHTSPGSDKPNTGPSLQPGSQQWASQPQLSGPGAGVSNHGTSNHGTSNHGMSNHGVSSPGQHPAGSGNPSLSDPSLSDPSLSGPSLSGAPHDPRSHPDVKSDGPGALLWVALGLGGLLVVLAAVLAGLALSDGDDETTKDDSNTSASASQAGGEPNGDEVVAGEGEEPPESTDDEGDEIPAVPATGQGLSAGKTGGAGSNGSTGSGGSGGGGSSRSGSPTVAAGLPPTSGINKAPPGIPPSAGGTAGIQNPATTGGQGRVGEAIAVKALEEITRCLNRAEPRAWESYRRYHSWVGAGGPACNGNVYGLYETYENSPEICSDALSAAETMDPSTAPLVAQGRKMVEAFNQMHPVLTEANVYYDAEMYQGDSCAKGKELHPRLEDSFSTFFDAAWALRSDLLLKRREADKAFLEVLEKSHGKTPEWHVRSVLMATRYLMNAVPRDRAVPDKNGATIISARLADFARSLEEFATLISSQPAVASDLRLTGLYQELQELRNQFQKLETKLKNGTATTDDIDDVWDKWSDVQFDLTFLGVEVIIVQDER